MPRDYRKESEWSKNRYKSVSVRLAKQYGERLDMVLRRDGLTVAEWIRQKIDKDTEAETKSLESEPVQ